MCLSACVPDRRSGILTSKRRGIRLIHGCAQTARQRRKRAAAQSLQFAAWRRGSGGFYSRSGRMSANGEGGQRGVRIIQRSQPMQRGESKQATT